MAKDNLIRVRVKGTTPRNGEIKKFKPMKELPIPGTALSDGTCYGGATKLEMSIYQNARDEDKLPLYDYYEVDILDQRLLKVDVDYICTPHSLGTKIPANLYNELFKLVIKSNDIDTFVRDALQLDLWEKCDVDKTGQEAYLKQMYIAANRTVSDIIKECGLSQVRLGKTFGISRRTIENWCSISPPPVYILLMMQECLGIYTRGN